MQKSQMKRALLQMMWAEMAQAKMLSGCFGDLTAASIALAPRSARPTEFQLIADDIPDRPQLKGRPPN
jgi:hypothetical protein